MEVNAASKREMLDETRPIKMRRVDEEGEKENNSCTIFKFFKKQDPAIDFCKEIGQGVKPFSVEYRWSSSGARKFQAAHPRSIWEKLKASKLSDRNAYEIITEDVPCKLYFDLEYEFEYNPEAVPQRLTQTFMKFVCWALEDTFNVKCTAEDVIILEATTAEKFSQHWIFPTVIFQTVRHTGAFVKFILELIDAGSGPLEKSTLETLYVQKRGGKKVVFVDKGVYTKNRNFRTYLSTKHYKNNPLLLSSENRWFCEKDESLFLSSLVTYIQDPTLPILSYEPEPNLCRGTLSQGVSQGALPSQATSEGVDDESPYPAIDRFMQKEFGRIRKWFYYEETKLMMYTFLNYRYCENIGRWHKSNNVYIVANPEAQSYYQKCCDPDCKHFRSDSKPLYLLSEKYVEDYEQGSPTGFV